MTLEERLALHRRLGAGYHDAYTGHLNRGGRVVFPDEWRISPDCVYRSPYFGGDQDGPIGKWVNTPGASMNDGATRELRLYLAHFPDWTAVEFLSWASEEGFFTRTRYAGATRRGVQVSAWLIDFFFTDAQGLITRWDGFVDGDEWGPIMQIVTGERGPFPDFKTYWRALAAAEKRLGFA
jgi:hypothetical protein